MEKKQSFLKMNIYKASFICMLLSFACLFLPWYRISAEPSPLVGGYDSLEEIAADDDVIPHLLAEYERQWDLMRVRGKYEVIPRASLETDADVLLSLYEMPFNAEEYLKIFRDRLRVLRRGTLSLMGTPAFRRNLEKLHTLDSVQSRGHMSWQPGTDEGNTYYYQKTYSEDLRLLTRQLYLVIGAFLFSLALYVLHTRIAILPYALSVIWFMLLWISEDYLMRDGWVNDLRMRDSSYYGLNYFIRYKQISATPVVHIFFWLAMAAAFLLILSLPTFPAKNKAERLFSGKKRLIPVIATAAVWIVLFVAWRNGAQMKNDVRALEQDGVYYVIHGEEASVAGLNLSPDTTRLDIPAEVEGYPVVSVLSLQGWRDERGGGVILFSGHHGTYSFYSKEENVHLEQLVLPDSVRTIWAHGLCSNCVTADEVVFEEGLQWIASVCEEKHHHPLFSPTADVELPASLRYFSRNAFSYCGMRSVRFQGKLIHEIPEGAFEQCTNLKSVDIPENVTDIYRFAFRDCAALTEVRGANALKSVYAFEGCTSLKRLDGFDKEKTRYNEASFEGTPFLE